MRMLAFLLAHPLLAACAAEGDRFATVYPWDQVKPTGQPCVDWLQLPRVNGVILGPNRRHKPPVIGCIPAARDNLISHSRRNIIITGPGPRGPTDE
jgi:hypothetical protein